MFHDPGTAAAHKVESEYQVVRPDSVQGQAIRLVHSRDLVGHVSGHRLIHVSGFQACMCFGDLIR